MQLVGNHRQAAPFRMFRNLPPADVTPEQLLRLAEEQLSYEFFPSSDLPTGYTYLGQFINHDITPPTHPDEADLGRTVTPAFDLDSVYGSGHRDDPSALLNMNTGLFMGPLTERGRICELTRSARTFLARIPDHRNDDNFIVSQLHVLFMNLHNYLVGLHKGAQDPFKAARNELIFLYRCIAWHDYARRILDPTVFKQLSCPNGGLQLIIDRPISSIPPEFSAAAFRFGHSLVRDRYTLNTRHRAMALATIIGLTSCGRLTDPEDIRKHRIDWSFFFEVPVDGAMRYETARMLSTHVLPELASVTIAAKQPWNIVQLDLLAGLQQGLPDGQSIVDHIRQVHCAYATTMNLAPLTPGDIAAHPLGPALKRLRLEGSTPLWTYILIEPFVEPGTGQRRSESGRRLGTLGSVIIGEVLRALLSDVTCEDDLARKTKSSLVLEHVLKLPANELRMHHVIGLLGKD